jgi:WD40 repeat protein
MHLAWNEEGVEVCVASVASGEILYRLPDVPSGETMAFSVDGGHLITNGPDHSIVMHDALTGEARANLAGHMSMLTAITNNPDGSTIASSDAGGSIRLWRADSGAALATAQVDGLYAGMNITGVTGISQAQRATLLALGAREA